MTMAATQVAGDIDPLHENLIKEVLKQRFGRDVGCFGAKYYPGSTQDVTLPRLLMCMIGTGDQSAERRQKRIHLSAFCR